MEPSCGTGNFFGLLPDSMAASRAPRRGARPTDGRGLRSSSTRERVSPVEGFEKTKACQMTTSMWCIGNVPFGEIRVNDSRYNAQKFLIHDYFFAKGIWIRYAAGGVVAFITSKGTMDKASPEVRKVYRPESRAVSERSDCPTTPSRQTQARRSRVISSFPAEA